MNLNKLFSIQAKLDERIIEEHGLQGEDLLDKKILALQVELGELANEWRGFKFWSKNQKPRNEVHYWIDDMGNETSSTVEPREDDIVIRHSVTNPLLEEYVDCLHFILSIGLEKWSEYDYQVKPVRERFLTDQFNWLFNKIGDFSRFQTKGNYFMIVNIFLGLGEMLGFTWKQIEESYLEKNRINHERQNNGY